MAYKRERLERKAGWFQGKGVLVGLVWFAIVNITLFFINRILVDLFAAIEVMTLHHITYPFLHTPGSSHNLITPMAGVVFGVLVAAQKSERYFSQAQQLYWMVRIEQHLAVLVERRGSSNELVG